MPPPEEKRYVTTKFAADYLKVSVRTVKAMIRDGRLTGYRIPPRMTRLDLNELDALVTPFGGAA
ncbi:excisionase family DNA-binding protein [Mycolicibacterium fortuitum]|uniref:excisionase family DNA-binding protein n=1 Tax=Mycolicibacterium fortuitum TaxID=1766 RepID=UPI00149061E5|nr:helix-turn-helix domain-containing protein [Mycolicibacterium fortuitum]